jgi:peptidyl-prolyl cis-trans isomerase D
VPGAGVEPALVAAAVNTPANQISKPVKGSNGVYVLKVNNIETIEVSPENVTNELNQNLTMKIDYQLVESMRENAEIVDRRAQFY